MKKMFDVLKETPFHFNKVDEIRELGRGLIENRGTG